MTDEQRTPYNLRPNPKLSVKAKEMATDNTETDTVTTDTSNTDLTDVDTSTPTTEHTTREITPIPSPEYNLLLTMLEKLGQKIEQTSVEVKQEVKQQLAITTEMKRQLEQTNCELTDIKNNIKVNNDSLEKIQNEFHASLETLSQEFQNHKSEMHNHQKLFQDQIKNDLTRSVQESRELIEKQTQLTNNKIERIENEHKHHFQSLREDIERTRTQTQTDIQAAVEENINHKLYEHQNKLDRLEEVVTKNQVPLKSDIHVTCMGNNGVVSDQQVPKFSGREKNPMEFLRKFHKHFERQKTLYTNLESNDLLHDLLDQALEKHASRWWHLNREGVQEWKDFEERFLEKYWSREVQRGIKNRLEVEKYQPGGNLSRSEYFIEKVLTLKSILPIPSDNEIVTILAEHFSEIIQDARRVQNVQTIREFELLLQREDLQDAHRTSRVQNRIIQAIPQRWRPNQDTQPQRQSSRPYQQYEQTQFHAYQPRTQHTHPQRNPQYANNNRPPNNGRVNPYYQGPRSGSPNFNQSSPPRRNQPYPTPEQRQLCHTIMEPENRRGWSPQKLENLSTNKID